MTLRWPGRRCWRRFPFFRPYLHAIEACDAGSGAIGYRPASLGLPSPHVAGHCRSVAVVCRAMPMISIFLWLRHAASGRYFGDSPLASAAAGRFKSCLRRQMIAWRCFDFQRVSDGCRRLAQGFIADAACYASHDARL